jgi:hypothetical protein
MLLIAVALKDEQIIYESYERSGGGSVGQLRDFRQNSSKVLRMANVEKRRGYWMTSKAW